MDNLSAKNEEPPHSEPRAATTLNQHLAVLSRKLSTVFADWAAHMEATDSITLSTFDHAPQRAVEHSAPAGIASADAHHGVAMQDAISSLPEMVKITNINAHVEAEHIPESEPNHHYKHEHSTHGQDHGRDQDHDYGPDEDHDCNHDCNHDHNRGYNDKHNLDHALNHEHDHKDDRYHDLDQQNNHEHENNNEHDHNHDRNQDNHENHDHDLTLGHSHDHKHKHKHDKKCESGHIHDCESERKRDFGHDEENKHELVGNYDHKGEHNTGPETGPKLREDVREDLHQEIEPEIPADVLPKIRSKVSTWLQSKLRPEPQQTLRHVLQSEVQPELQPGLQPQTSLDIWSQIHTEVRSGGQPGLETESYQVQERFQTHDYGMRPEGKLAEKGVEAVFHSRSELGEAGKRTRSWTPDKEDMSSEGDKGSSARHFEISASDTSEGSRLEGDGKPKRKRRRQYWTVEENEVFLRTVRVYPHLRGIALVNCVCDALGGKRSASQVRRRFSTLLRNGTMTQSLEWGQRDGPVKHRQP